MNLLTMTELHKKILNSQSKANQIKTLKKMLLTGCSKASAALSSTKYIPDSPGKQTNVHGI